LLFGFVSERFISLFCMSVSHLSHPFFLPCFSLMLFIEMKGATGTTTIMNNKKFTITWRRDTPERNEGEKPDDHTCQNRKFGDERMRREEISPTEKVTLSFFLLTSNFVDKISHHHPSLY